MCRCYSFNFDKFEQDFVDWKTLTKAFFTQLLDKMEMKMKSTALEVTVSFLNILLFSLSYWMLLTFENLLFYIFLSCLQPTQLYCQNVTTRCCNIRATSLICHNAAKNLPFAKYIILQMLISILQITEKVLHQRRLAWLLYVSYLKTKQIKLK